MLTWIINKTNTVRRLRAELSAAIARHETDHAALARERAAHNSTLSREAEALGKLDHIKQKRTELHRQIDEQREITIKQAASIEILMKDRAAAQERINEQRLTAAESRDREERFLRTIDTLNSTLRLRDSELADTREELAAAETEIERKNRPVLFQREGGFSERELTEILAGKGNERVVKAIMQLLDTCAVEAMSESAAMPSDTFSEGGRVIQGFTQEQRTYCSGGAFALTEFKRVLEGRLSIERREPEARAA